MKRRPSAARIWWSAPARPWRGTRWRRHARAVLMGAAGALAAVLACWLMASLGRQVADARRTYSVAAVRANLARRPEAWAGRAGRVRGMVLSSGCLAWDAGVYAPCRDGASLLPVAEGRPDRLLATLRRLPLVGRLVPAPQQLRWGALATYRVRLRAAPTPVRGMPPCYEVLLLDAAPDSL